MRVTNDDQIHRFEPRWIDLRGTEMPVHARYRIWAIFGGYALILVLLILMLGVGVDDALIFGLPGAGLAALFTSVYITPETPSIARVQQLRSELSAWRLDRRRKAIPVPATIRSSSLQRRIHTDADVEARKS